MHDWLNRFLDHLDRERGLSALTVDGYRRELARFVAYLESQGVDAWSDVDTTRVREYVSRRHRQGAGSASCQRALSAMRTLYKYLLREGALAHNPAVGVSAPRGTRRLPDALDVDRVSALLDRPPETDLEFRDRAMFELMYSSGLRLAETVSLDMGDVDLRESLVSVTGKGAKQRIVPVGSVAREWVDEWLKLRPARVASGEKALFVGRRGKRLTARAVQARLARWAAFRVWIARCTRTCCVTPSRATCSNPAAISGRSRSCSATPTSALPRSTLTSTSSTWRRSTTRPTPGRGGGARGVPVRPTAESRGAGGVTGRPRRVRSGAFIHRARSHAAVQGHHHSGRPPGRRRRHGRRRPGIPR